MAALVHFDVGRSKKHEAASKHPPHALKVREVLKTLRRDGWEVVRQRGSHRQLKHAVKQGTVTVAGEPGVDIPPGTLKSIWKQSGLDE